MNKLLTLLALGASLSFTGAQAQDKAAAPAAAPTAQQSKMTTCNKDASGMKGDERKTFMKTCLSAAKPMTQQDKMKSCNADTKAKTLKGDERKSFMKGCLSSAA